MSKQIAYIPLSGIGKLEIRVTNRTKTMAQVKQESGADYILNGGMWNSNGSPCPILKAGGALLSEVPWGAYGYGWNTGADIRLESNWGLFENFLSCTCLIGPWGAVDKPSYDAAQGGTRGDGSIDLRRVVEETALITPRQRQVLLLTLDGYSRGRIAGELGVDPTTAGRTLRRGEKWYLDRKRSPRLSRSYYARFHLLDGRAGVYSA